MLIFIDRLKLKFVAERPPPPRIAFQEVLKAAEASAAENQILMFFFAKPDVLSDLFTLANFRSANPQAVMAPFSAGCGSIIGYPLLESYTPNQRAVVGMFDPSARPHVGKNVLSFAAPIKKFAEMIEDMDESFLITPTWKRIRKRMKS